MLGEPRRLQIWALFQHAAVTMAVVSVMSVISKFGHCFSMRLLQWQRRMRSTGGGSSDVRNLGTVSLVYAHIWCVPASL